MVVRDILATREMWKKVDNCPPNVSNVVKYFASYVDV